MPTETDECDNRGSLLPFKNKPAALPLPLGRQAEHIPLRVFLGMINYILVFDFLSISAHRVREVCQSVPTNGALRSEDTLEMVPPHRWHPGDRLRPGHGADSLS